MSMIGESIGRYTITAKLGEGGMGEVYLATDTSLDRPVALKFLPTALQRDPDARERLLREARAVSKLNHKNVLTIFSVESIDGRDFLVMEYVEGRTLKDMLDGGEDIPVDQLLRIGLQICDGLAAAHEQGIVHRDIKPANILLTAKGQVTIADFGLATWRGAGQLTKEGSTVGTAAYMSPEQVQGGAVDVRSDIFSAGVVLYELITRNLPFKGDHDAAFAYAILNDAPEPLARYKSNVHPGLQVVIDHALDKDPSTRYPNASAMLVDLKRVRKELEGSNPSGQSRVQSRITATQPKKSYLKPVLAGSAVLVIALIFFILKPFKFDVAPEQKASAADNSLAVMYFDNLVDSGDNDKTAQMITSLLITGLSESKYLQVTSRQRLYDILAQLGKEDVKSIDHTTATAVAKKAGVKWIVTGEILQVNPKVVLTAEVSEVESGKLVTTQRVSGNAGDDLFALVDSMSAAIRGNLSLPDVAKAEVTQSVANVTTHSPEAYRAYLDGVDYNLKFYATEARESFKRAISYDSTFAMAYLRLAVLNSGAAPSPEDMSNARQAKRYADRASWKEQRYIAAINYGYDNRAEEELAELDQLLERFPDEKDAYMMKSSALNRLGRISDAVTVLERMVEVDPTSKLGYNQLAYSYDVLGQFDKSIAAINKYIALAPNEANPYDSRAELYAYNGRLEEAIKSYREALDRKHDFYPSAFKLGQAYMFKGDYGRADSVFRSLASCPDRDVRSEARVDLSIIPMRQGKYAEALRVIDEGVAADRMEEYQGFWSMIKIAARAGVLHSQRDYPQALATLRKFQETNKTVFPDDFVNSRPWEVGMMAESGDTSGARRVAETLRKDIERTDTSQMREYWFATAHIAFEAGRYAEAISLLERVPMQLGSQRRFEVRYLLGNACLRNGSLEKAVSILEKAASTFDNSQAQTPRESVLIHYLLGLAYEQSGWKDKAVEQYKQFLNIWKDADPGIPEIDDAKARLAKLAA